MAMAQRADHRAHRAAGSANHTRTLLGWACELTLLRCSRGTLAGCWRERKRIPRRTEYK